MDLVRWFAHLGEFLYFEDNSSSQVHFEVRGRSDVFLLVEFLRMVGFARVNDMFTHSFTRDIRSNDEGSQVNPCLNEGLSPSFFTI